MATEAELVALVWPEAEAGACLRQVAAQLEVDAGAAAGGAETGPVAARAAAAGLDADAAGMAWGETAAMLARAGPALLEVKYPVAGFVALLPARGRRRVVVLDRRGRRRVVAAGRLARALRTAECGDAQACAAGAAPGDAQALLAPVCRSARRRRRLRQALHASAQADQPDVRLHLLSVAAPVPVGRELRRAGMVRAALLLVMARGAQQAMLLAAAAWLAAAGIGSAVEPAWLAAMGLLWVSAAALRSGAAAIEQRLVARGALVVRQQLFARLVRRGGLRAAGPQELAGEGTGGLLGRLLAGEALESPALAGLPAAVFACCDLAVALPILWLGAAPRLHSVLWCTSGGVWVALAATVRRRRRALAAHRQGMTHGLVEKLAAQRTRRVQEHAERRRRREDADLARHHELAARSDRAEVWLAAVMPRACLLVGILLLGVALAGSDVPPAGGRVAASLAGVWLSYGAWSELAAAVVALVEAETAAAQLRPLLRSGDGDGAPAGERSPAGGDVAGGSAAVLAAHRLRVGGGAGACGARPLHQGDLDVAIAAGDRVVLTGPSGAGKSTLARQLAAVQAVSAGVLLLHGLDVHVWGAAAWRRRVCLVHQLHANHVFAASLAFNLLFGRAWPPGDADLAEAERLCRRLGLGPLLDRLPMGLDQRIGEGGWRLSDGEASRVCLARGLLQEPEVLILDESLAALDPACRAEVLAAVEALAKTVVLVAHV